MVAILDMKPGAKRGKSGSRVVALVSRVTSRPDGKLAKYFRRCASCVSTVATCFYVATHFFDRYTISAHKACNLRLRYQHQSLLLT